MYVQLGLLSKTQSCNERVECDIAMSDRISDFFTWKELWYNN